MLRQRAISALVSLLLTLQPSLSAATQPSPKATSPQQVISKTASLLTDVHQQLDRTAFDFEAVLDQLDYEADAIISFSKSAIAFEQYPGVLRGPRGALFSRAGNAIDQAALLAKLLRDAGYDARIAGAELTLEHAKMVLGALTQPVTPPPPMGDTTGLINALQKHGLVEPVVTDEARQLFSDYVQNPPGAKRYPAYSDVRETAKFISDTLRGGGVHFDASKIEHDLLAEARDYYWVQYQTDVAGAWIDVHPVFTGAPPFLTPAPSSYISETIPSNLQHRIRMQVFIERKTGSKLEALPVTSVWEQPVANLIGKPLTFANFADSMGQPESMMTTLDTTLAKARSFVPTFGATLAPGAQFFDIRGNIIDPMAASSPAAGIFAEINRAFGDALGELAGKDNIPTLTAQWMDFTLIAPDGSETQFRRTTFDRIGPAARESRNVPPDMAPTTLEDVRPLLQRHTLGVTGSRTPRGYIIESIVASFRQWTPGLTAILSGDSKPAKPISPDWENLLSLFSLLDLADTLGDHHRNYRSGPGLLIYSDGLGQTANYIERVDIVANPRRVFDVSGQYPAFDPGTMVQAGVWETLVEGAFLSGANSHNTIAAFATASDLGATPIVLNAGTEHEQLTTSADVKASIGSDITRGYAVIAPSKVKDLAHAGWWRVNPRTGETLGQATDGRGAAISEEAVTLIISLAFLAYGWAGCVDSQIERNESRPGFSGWDAQGNCCLLANVGLTAFTYVIGGWALALDHVSRSVRTQAVALSALMDFEASTIPVDDVCAYVFAD